MRLVHCACAPDSPTIPGASRHLIPEVPGRGDLAFLDAIAKEVLPVDPTPSLEEIAKSPSVSHLGEPDFAPQLIDDPLRLIISGPDSALGAVLTRMMRRDYLWAEIAYLPADPASPAAVLWGLSDLSAEQRLTLAVEGPVRPIPCIRNDSGVAVAGSATLTHTEDAPYIGEIVVDNTVLLSSEPSPGRRSSGRRAPLYYGARLVPTVDAPGLAAAAIVGPAQPPARKGWLQKLARPKPFVASPVDPTHTPTGRALQSGGESILVTVDGIPAPRPVNRVTFYRHLRDVQAVRGDTISRENGQNHQV